MSIDSAAHAELAASEAADAARVAVRHLAEHGYDATTTNELADAIGMSRSTFFRRFGSKEDLIFADHEISLTALERMLEAATDDPVETITRGAVDRMHRIVSDPEHARLRSELLRQTPALRDHELVITHRYERLFSRYIAARATPGTPKWVPTALGAGIVAVHNAAVREWLRNGDARELGHLERDLLALISRFSPWFGPVGVDPGAARVVVAAFEANSSPDDVLEAIKTQLAAGH